MSKRSEILKIIRSRIDKVASSWESAYLAPDIPEKILYLATWHLGCWETGDDVLAVIDITLSDACDEGFVFTSYGMHYTAGNQQEFFNYEDIEGIRVISHWLNDKLGITTKYGESIIDIVSINKKELMWLLIEISSLVTGHEWGYRMGEHKFVII